MSYKLATLTCFLFASCARPKLIVDSNYPIWSEQNTIEEEVYPKIEDSFLYVVGYGYDPILSIASSKAKQNAFEQIVGLTGDSLLTRAATPLKRELYRCMVINKEDTLKSYEARVLCRAPYENKKHLRVWLERFLTH